MGDLVTFKWNGCHFANDTFTVLIVGISKSVYEAWHAGNAHTIDKKMYDILHYVKPINNSYNICMGKEKNFDSKKDIK